jgi:hypothetical protein
MESAVRVQRQREKRMAFPNNPDVARKFCFVVAGQQAGNGSKRRAPCQLENRCQLQPKLVAELSARGVSVAARTNPSDPWQLIGPAF